MISDGRQRAGHVPSSSPGAARWGILVGVVVAWLVVVAIEFFHLGAGGDQGAGPAWLRDLDLSPADTQLWFWILPVLAGLLLWPGRRTVRPVATESDVREVEAGSEYHPLTSVTLLVAAIAGLAHWGLLTWVDSEMGGATPAYHDESSYLLQAQTIGEWLGGARGKGISLWTQPSAQPEELFDQMHVWNRGVRASRYFPGTGLWLAVCGGTTDESAVLAIQLAGCLAVVCWTLVAGRLGGNAAAGVAGIFLAVAPGCLLFDNLILAHAPTVLGLGLLYLAWTYQPAYGAQRDPTWRACWGWSLAAGTGLAGAMVCRPVTAAGVALPLGLVWLTRCFHSRCPVNGCASERRLSLGGTLGLGLPLLVGFAIMAGQNQVITGSFTTTAYSAYTERFTPRHVYGFNNRVRGERQMGSEVWTHYDEWTENLTLPLAGANLGRRLVSSWRYTVGLIPGIVVCGLIAGVYGRLSTVTRSLLGGIVGLHAVYFPYWFDGIMHWHYVYESAPLWILLLAVSSVEVGRQAWLAGQRAVAVVGGLALIVAVVGQLVPVGSPLPTRLAVGISELRFAKRKYQAFDAVIDQQVRVRPAVVAVIPDPDDRHIDFVRNPAHLDGPVLIVRHLPDRFPLDRFGEWFPGRAVFTVDAKTGDVRRIAGATQPSR